jgi:uncharacterized protein (TIRG00374 family)
MSSYKILWKITWQDSGLEKKYSKVVISVLSAVGLCAALWRYLNIREFADVIRNISLQWLGVTLFLFITYQWFRTLRFSLLADANGCWPLFNTMCIHSFLNNTLPTGLGEVALVYLLRRMHDVTYSTGVAALLVARFIDLAVFSLLFLLIGLAFHETFPPEIYFVMLVIFILLIFAAILFRIVATFKIKSINTVRSRIKTRLIQHYNALSISFRQIGKSKIWTKLIVYSAGMWTCMYFFFGATIHSLGFSLSLDTVFMLYLILFPINMLPI